MDCSVLQPRSTFRFNQKIKHDMISFSYTTNRCILRVALYVSGRPHTSSTSGILWIPSIWGVFSGGWLLASWHPSTHNKNNTSRSLGSYSASWFGDSFSSRPFTLEKDVSVQFQGVSIRRRHFREGWQKQWIRMVNQYAYRICVYMYRWMKK